MSLKKRGRMYQLLAEHEELHAAGERHPQETTRELHDLIAESGEQMLLAGRIPLSDAEHAAVDKLIEQNPDEPVSMTRRDPGETGPLLVHVGDDTYLVDANGKPRRAA